MHCASYSQGDYYPRDVIPGATGISLPQLNNEITMRSGTGYNILFQQLPVNHYMGYFKEVMKQALLKHEATFRYQVNELHHLYRRQKELMNEVQRRYTYLHMSQLNPVTDPVQSHISQVPVHVADWPSLNGRGCHPSFFSAEKFDGPFGARHSEPLYTNPSINKESGQEECKVLPSITNKLGKRMLDLELPPDQYSDSEKEDNNVEESAEVPPKETSGFESDSKHSSLPPIDSCSLNSTSGRPTCLIDLNEPFQLDESEFLIYTSHVESVMGCMETTYVDLDLSQKLKKELEVLDDGRDGTIWVEKDISDACPNILHSEAKQVELLSHHLEAGLGSPTSNAFMGVSSTERTMLGSKFSEEVHDLLGEGHSKILGTCISSLHEFVPHSVESDTKALCSSSFGRKLIQDSRKKVVQALPCFYKPNLSAEKSNSASESSIKNKETHHMKRNLASNPSFGNLSSYPTVSSDKDPNADLCSPSKCLRNSACMKSSGEMELHRVPPSQLSAHSTPPERYTNGDGENYIEDSVKALGWQSKLHIDSEAIDFPGLAKSNTSVDPYKVEDVEKNEKGEKRGRTTACGSISMSVDCSKGDLAVGSGISNLSICKAPFQLKTSRIGNKPSPSTSERDLEAPASPENKESSPPRGESDNFQLEEPFQLSKEDFPDLEELDKIAAETIISIFSSGVHKRLEAVTNKASKCLGGSLDWFAGVVSSVAENENNYEYFVNLNEMEAKDVSYRSNEQNNEETAQSLLPTQQGRGRRTRQQRTLKRKALNTLGAPKRATGSALETSTKRKRNMGENDFAKRRPHFDRIHCKGLEQVMCSPQFSATKGKNRGRCLGGWGFAKGQRRPRSARTGFDDFPPLADLRRLLS